MYNSGDYQVCVTEADAFLYIVEPYGENAKQLLCGMMYPFSVNASFACELYMKAIMIYNSPNNEFTKGHDLKMLFENIPPIAQLEIRKLYCEKSQKTWTNYWMNPEMSSKNGGMHLNRAQKSA